MKQLLMVMRCDSSKPVESTHRHVFLSHTDQQLTQQLHTNHMLWQYKTKSEITFCWTWFRAGSLSHCLSFQPFLMLYRLLLVLLEAASSCLLLHLSAGGWGGGGGGGGDGETINNLILYMEVPLLPSFHPRFYLSLGKSRRFCMWPSANMMSVRV